MISSPHLSSPLLFHSPPPGIQRGACRGEGGPKWHYKPIIAPSASPPPGSQSCLSRSNSSNALTKMLPDGSLRRPGGAAPGPHQGDKEARLGREGAKLRFYEEDLGKASWSAWKSVRVGGSARNVLGGMKIDPENV